MPPNVNRTFFQPAFETESEYAVVSYEMRYQEYTTVKSCMAGPENRCLGCQKEHERAEPRQVPLRIRF